MAKSKKVIKATPKSPSLTDSLKVNLPEPPALPDVVPVTVEEKNAGEKIAASADAFNAKQNEEQVRVKRKYTRRVKAGDATPSAQNLAEDEKVKNLLAMSEDFSNMAGEFLNFFGRRMPNPIPTKDHEVRGISSALKPVLVKWIPKAGEYGAEIMLAGAIGMWMFPRMIPEKKNPMQKLADDANKIIASNLNNDPPPVLP